MEMRAGSRIREARRAGGQPFVLPLCSSPRENLVRGWSQEAAMANEETPQPAKLKPAIVEGNETPLKGSKTVEAPSSQRLMGLVAYFLALLLLALGGLVYLLWFANYTSPS